MSKKINISEFGDCFSEEMLVKYVNNELSNEENSVIDRHLAHCDMCSDVVDGLLMMESADAVFAEKEFLDKEIDKLVAGSTKRRILLNTKFRAIAAVGLLLIISGTYFIANYLTNKNSNIVVETAEKDNTFDNQQKPVLTENEQKLAGLEEKKVVQEQQSGPFFFSSPIHEFDSDQKVSSNEITDEEIEKTVTDHTVNVIDLVNRDSYSTVSEDKEEGSPGTGTYSGGVSVVTQSSDSRKGDISGGATGETASAKEVRSSGGIFSIFDLPDKKLEEVKTNKVSSEEKDGVKDRESTRNERNNNQAPASTDNVVVTETISIADAKMIYPEEEADESEVIPFTTVEQKPQFLGGDSALLKFIADNVTYPDEAKALHLEGKVYVKFVIDKEGYVTNIEVAKGVGPSLDEEAIRVVKLMPRWTPARQNDKPVAVTFVLPITFKFN